MSSINRIHILKMEYTVDSGQRNYNENALEWAFRNSAALETFIRLLRSQDIYNRGPDSGVGCYVGTSVFGGRNTRVYYTYLEYAGENVAISFIVDVPLKRHKITLKEVVMLHEGNKRMKLPKKGEGTQYYDDWETLFRNFNDFERNADMHLVKHKATLNSHAMEFSLMYSTTRTDQNTGRTNAVHLKVLFENTTSRTTAIR